ncbi:universal stress protein [Streptomyces sp. NPDC000987]|uniref:universal stress protein n=1 Tax=Streptomyces sp. NPDC000987 TaxID=3154374 RepID=UPI00332B6E07
MEAALVVGVDGSESSLEALDWAVREAARHALPLRLVYASLWERYEPAAPSAGAGPRGPLEQVTVENTVASAVQRARRTDPGVRIGADVVADDPAAALLRAGRDAFAVVTGSRGRGELAGLLLGSVGLTVAARADCPVIVVRGDRAGIQGTHERILLGADDPARSGEAARFAFREARARDCTLDVVRAWRRPAPGTADRRPSAGDAAGDHEQRASALLDDLLRQPAAEGLGPRLRRHTVEGPARRVLVNRSAAADLVVIGAQRRHGRHGLQLGTVAHTLLHHAACPVAVVPQRA